MDWTITLNGYGSQLVLESLRGNIKLKVIQNGDELFEITDREEIQTFFSNCNKLLQD